MRTHRSADPWTVELLLLNAAALVLLFVAALVSGVNVKHALLLLAAVLTITVVGQLARRLAQRRPGWR